MSRRRLHHHDFAASAVPSLPSSPLLATSTCRPCTTPDFPPYAKRIFNLLSRCTWQAPEIQLDDGRTMVLEDS